MQPRPPLSSFNMPSPTALLKNKMNQASFKARQFVSGATNAFTNTYSNTANNAVSNPVKANRFASSGSNGSGSGIVSDGEYKMFTRDELNNLYGNGNGNRGVSFMNTNFFNLGDGPIEHIIMMFQLYIALVAALSRLSMNAASMSTSFIFGNETLINIFSIFLENALNLILNRNVANMTLDELKQSLEMNKPQLQQMSALLIKEISELALGLSDVCSKIAMDWINNILPGLVKSAAIGIPSAVEAAVPPLGELVEILTTGAAAVAGMMKIMKGFQSNYGNFSEGFGKVSNAYDGILKLKELLSKPPSEIAAAATAAAIPKAAQVIAEKAVNTLTSAGNPYLSSAAATAGLGAATAGLDASPATPATSFKSLIRDATGKGVNIVANAGLNAATTLAKKGLEQGVRGVASAIKGVAAAAVPPRPQPEQESSQPSESSIRNLANKIKENFGTVKDMAQKFGITVTGLSGLAEKIRTNSQLAVYLAKRFGMTVTGLQGSMLTRLANELEHLSGDPENASVRRAKIVGRNIRPIATGLKNVSKYLDEVSGGRGKNKMKSRKYLKNKKHFKKYMSNLRRKTAKKELDLLNGIRDFKSIISL